MANIICTKCGYGKIIIVDEEAYCEYCHSSYEEDQEDE